jgi:superfamily II DNA or RNA helicase
MTGFTPYHSQYLAHRLTLEGATDDAFAKSLSTARVDLNPHQVDAALFALGSPISKGVVLADEVGLGKTIEASLVIAQRWAEHRRQILLIVPASLRKQWSQELQEKFSLPAVILEARSYREEVKAGHRQPFSVTNRIVITSYEFAARRADDIKRIDWDLVIFDEAHRLRNVYRKGTATRAKALRDAVRGRFKLLLTATPLQNSLMELYGLTSVIDERLFGDESSFRTLYGGANPTPDNLLVLRERLKPVCHRTLRRSVQEAGLISFTRRIPATFRFEPGDDEFRLYTGLSAYLQRRDTLAFGGRPNQLVTLIVRKILGSSTFAVAQTLTAIIDRLGRIELPDIADVADVETADEEAEEWEDGGEDAAGQGPPAIDPTKLKAEIAELSGYRDLALRIPANAKGENLVAKLPEMLEEIVARGGQCKAVIFTESVRTQTYLAELLAVRGYAGEIALLNGSNKDTESQAIYSDWLARHQGTDAVSGSPSADMKAAIVEAFRTNKTILIATESGAEGINLQFCSLLVNFDLPWNPQRVEQRIGRCHRYGQKIDVTVVNFLNLKNHAEQRIFQLLDQKFRLFDGVFGASDEVLGAIESGVDFERRVLEIVQSARSETEINAEFDRLQTELQGDIDAAVLDARKRLLDRVDEDVVRRLKSRKGELSEVMGAFEQRLLTLARAELPEARFHPDAPRRFDHDGKTWTTEWPLADEQNWQFFRLAEGNLASTIAAAARDRTLPLATVRFEIAAYPGGRLTRVEALAGQAGWLRVVRLTVKAAGEATTHLLLAAVTDGGAVVDEEAIDRLFLVPGTQHLALGLAPPEAALDATEAALRAHRLTEAEAANAAWMEQETGKLDAYADDMERAADTEMRSLEAEVKARRKALRANTALPVAAKVEEQRAVKKLEARRDELMLARFERKRALRQEIEDILDQVQASLSIQPTIEPVFTMRWEVA